MRWTITAGNILDVPADVLVCSANVFLNLSGGVGGEILLRHGDAMQQELHAAVARGGKRFVQQGAIVETLPHGLPFNAVLHAVAVDGFYQSSPQIVRDVVDRSLQRAASHGARRVALTALATGFGRMSMAVFAEAIAPILRREYPPITDVIVCVRHETNRDAILRSSALRAEPTPDGEMRGPSGMQ